MQTTLKKEFLLIDHQGRSLFDIILRWFNREFPDLFDLIAQNTDLYLTIAYLTL